MENIFIVEPQLAIPVVGVVLCALLVYIFGFQKSQEPSFQHLALLQETKGKSANGNLRQRSSTPQVKANTKAKDKSVANGHAVQEKASPKPNGTVKSPKPTRDTNNKENVRPQQQQKATPKKVKIPKDEAEDLESGDWIQAVSRKDKKSKKESVITPKPSKAVVHEEKPVTVLRDVTSTKTQDPVKQEEVTTPVAEPPTPKPVQTTPKKVKETKAEKIVTPPVEASPKKTEKKVVAPKVEEKKTLITEESEISKENASPAVSVKETPKVVEASEPKSNIAFDEMGDTWEEAKSARTKKRKARKD